MRPPDGDLYRWRGDADQKKMYPYVKDAIDIAAFNLYAASGRLPPQRPGGFLDDAEEAQWNRFRERVEEVSL